MPKLIKAYKCAFGCRRAPSITEYPMLKHEKTCCRNPERKACATCFNDANFQCLVNAKSDDVIMAVDCPQWRDKQSF